VVTAEGDGSAGDPAVRRAEFDRLAERLHAVESDLAIRQLKATYGELADLRLEGGQPAEPAVVAGLAARIAELFTEDATWDGGPALGIATGREQIRARFERPTLRFSRHLFVSPRIAVTGDTATGRWDVLCPCIGRDGTSYWMSGIEDDTYHRVDGRWLHSSMRMTPVFMVPVGDGWGDTARPSRPA
jgi:hypothetical protein